jgi:two-component sensor histidine kinase
VRALEDLRARFSVTRIHVDFDEGGANSVALDQLLAKVAHDIAALYDPTGRHTLSVVLAPLALPGPRALIVGQILIELLINAYRHGLADRAGGKVWIELARYGADAILLVADDGLAAADSEPAPFGLSMAANLARTIGGGFEPESRDSHVARVRFPLNGAPAG